MKILTWPAFWAAQLVSAALTIVGWFVLIPFCAARAWRDSATPSINDGRVIDEWSFAPLNWIYGNPEDGVSGKDALIWTSATTRSEYMPGANDAWRAYCWSAWRNSTNNLKYVFRWRGSTTPFASGSFTLFGKAFNYGFGWKVENRVYKVPVVGCKPA